MNPESYFDGLHPEFKVSGFYSDWLTEGQSGCFYFLDHPFVVTGTVKLAAGGYLVDYWVSGLSWDDLHDAFVKQPRLLLKTTLGLRQKKNSAELDRAVMEVWNLQLAELVLLAANEGQMVRLEGSIPEDEETSFHAKWQLMGHHKLGTFDDGDHGNPTTVRAARQYELLKSMGYTRPQKAIIEFETRVLQTELMMTALEGRLTAARNKKLILLKEETEQNREFFLEDNEWVDLR